MKAINRFIAIGLVVILAADIAHADYPSSDPDLGSKYPQAKIFVSQALAPAPFAAMHGGIRVTVVLALLLFAGAHMIGAAESDMLHPPLTSAPEPPGAHISFFNKHQKNQKPKKEPPPRPEKVPPNFDARHEVFKHTVSLALEENGLLDPAFRGHQGPHHTIEVDLAPDQLTPNNILKELHLENSKYRIYIVDGEEEQEVSGDKVISPGASLKLGKAAGSDRPDDQSFDIRPGYGPAWWLAISAIFGGLVAGAFSGKKYSSGEGKLKRSVEVMKKYAGYLNDLESDLKPLQRGSSTRENTIARWLDKNWLYYIEFHILRDLLMNSLESEEYKKVWQHDHVLMSRATLPNSQTTVLRKAAAAVASQGISINGELSKRAA